MKKYRIFILLCLLTMLEGYILLKCFNIDKIIHNILISDYNEKEIQQYFTKKDKWSFYSYFLIPILIYIKTIIVTSVIYIGTFFYSKTQLKFKSLWHLVVKSECVFLVVGVLKLVWFYFFQTNYTLEDIQYFYPLSALNIIGYKGLESWLIYPLQTLNVFELAYIIILSYQLGTLTLTNPDTGLKIVASSYIPALLLWVTIIMFFTLNFS